MPSNKSGSKPSKMTNSNKQQQQSKSEKKIGGNRKTTDESDGSSGRSIFRILMIVGLAIIFGVLQRNHVATMFENDRHFSHLSDLEREMTFRTEMGLYYSYFKTVVRSPSFVEGLRRITQDNVTEYGHTINTLKRFNLYPELILAAMYRIYNSTSTAFKIKTQECWKTERGQGWEPIVSCEGMGNQYYFYINWVFAITGTVASTIFLFGVLLSDSIIGGFIAVAAFFFNHGEATRVQWTPPLRESFGYPVFLAQMLVVSYIIKYRLRGTFWSSIVAFLTTVFMLFWQFASFALSTQVGSIFVAFVFGYVSLHSVRTISLGLLGAFVGGFVLLFGNEMLLTSLFLSSLITIQLIVLLNSTLDRIPWRLAKWTIKMILFGVGTLGIKFVIGSVLNVKDDAHVFDMLRSKFSDYSDFHTRLYTCAAEFDFMQAETIWKMLKTLLLPAGIVALLMFGVLILKYEWRTSGESADRNKSYGEIVYNVVQLMAFTVMAVLIMRLKLFFTPHLCIIASLLASKRVISDLTGGRIQYMHQQAVCVLLIGLMAVEGFRNLQHQWSIKGEYSNPNQEKLFAWIVKNTPKDAVFAGSMPTMANVKLSTERPIVNHPHYEDSALRERVMNVYSIFSRKPASDVHRILKEMKVNFVVFEFGWCYKGGRPGCSLPELWDLHDVENRGKTPLCEHFKQGNYAPFTVAYQNDHYKVLKVQ